MFSILNLCLQILSDPKEVNKNLIFLHVSQSCIMLSRLSRSPHGSTYMRKKSPTHAMICADPYAL